ncbi:MAG: FkbM family methyltransferase [Chitinispirillales bacterium]|jgi:FkbM family methyltransferase|nr:FkbM family methyltransferase [Chitinispirillales bacterium]
MNGKFFGIITRFARKRKLQNNFFVKAFIPVFHKLQRVLVTRVVPPAGENNTLACALRDNFLARNESRVKAVTNMLADEKSKKTYTGMVNFRKTGLKKDFPFSAYEKRAYFIDEVTLDKDEVFIDCGAFTGDTVGQFLKLCKHYKRIVAFEPDSDCFSALTKKHGGNPKITLINGGVYDSDSEISFDQLGGGDSRITSEKSGSESLRIKVKAIDNLNLEKVTFIKMDVEGAEMPALKGAAKTILADKPKLAICIYHSNEDMVRIAEYINSLVPQYKLYVRQHFLFPSAAETVLYALP